MIPLDQVRTALFVPASNLRAVAKARTLPCDMVILDLEDSVPDQDKDSARQTVRETAEAWESGLLAARLNPIGHACHAADIAALAHAAVDLVVVPKVEEAAAIDALATRLGKPILAMIETPAGIYAAREIAAAPGVAGLIVGPNDLAATLRLPTFAGRGAMIVALQSILLAARAAGVVALDGVYNRLDNPDGFEADCLAGRETGFDGKTLIHPSQIDPANRVFGPSAQEIEDAEALIAAASGGAERFRGRMIEGMHVDAARRILARSQAR
jgi:citrate lyase subunit beta/citryl-CoA lyase